MTAAAAPFTIVPGEPRARTLIKGLLAHWEERRDQHWTAVDWPEDRIHSRPVVHVIAMEETGRTTAIEHVDLGPLVTGHEYADWLLTVVAPLEQDPTFHVTAFHVDITVSFTSALQRVDRTLLAKGLRGWCARQLAAAPEGASRHVMTVADTSLQLQVEKSPCPGERGRVSMFHAHPPVDFEGAVSRQLQTCLGTLLAAPADRCVLLFEKRDHLWSAGQLRIELEAALTFPSLGRVYEIWMVDTRAAAATFRCVIPAGHWADRHHDTAS